MKRVGLIGCGSIGSVLAAALRRGRLPGRLVAVCDLRPGAAAALARRVRPVPRVTNLAGVFRAADVVVECAGGAVVPAVLRAAARHPRAVLVMSVGGLLRVPGLLVAAHRAGARVAVPSGALAGLDALRAAGMGRLDRVTLVTRKPPASLVGAPHLRGRRAWLLGLRRPTTVFRGSAAAAVRGFPANVNVAAAASLAGIGPRRTRVTVIAEPGLKVNIHELRIEGEFGRAVCRAENRPSPDNPRTSRLASLSALYSLRELLR